MAQARVADFGLARRMQARGAMDTFTALAPEATVVMGTFGYVAPEYARTGEIWPRLSRYLHLLFNQPKSSDVGEIIFRC